MAGRRDCESIWMTAYADTWGKARPAAVAAHPQTTASVHPPYAPPPFPKPPTPSTTVLVRAVRL